MPTNKQRRDAARRRLERQLQRRVEREARRRRVTLISSVVLTVVLIAAIITTVLLLGSGTSKKPQAAPQARHSRSSSAPASPSSSASVPSYPCTWLPSAANQNVKTAKLPSTTTPPKHGTVTVAVRTTQGPMTFRLNRAKAPCTVASFVSLVSQGFYDKSPCHRLVTSGIYVLQCGDPSGTGNGGPGYSIPDEATGKETYPAGTIAMARSQAPHSGGSQFFIVYKNSPRLMQHLGTLQYTVFGTVTSGLSVVQKVAAKGAQGGHGDGKPKLPISITAMKLAK